MNSNQVTNNAGRVAMKMVAKAVEQTKFDVAKSMGSQGYSIEQIYQVTGLSMADIKQILD